jgi:hypothetical protein
VSGARWPASFAGAIVALNAVIYARAGERQDSHVQPFKLGMALTAINGAR